MAYDLKGTNVKAASISAAVNFAMAQDRHMLRILKEKLTSEQIAELEREAAETVLASGQFARVTTSASQ